MASRDRDRLSNAKGGAFRDRQVLIRDSDAVYAVRLPSRRQYALVLAGGVALGAVLAMAAGLVWQHRIVDTQAERIAAARDAHGNVKKRVESILAEARVVDARLPAPGPAGVARPIDADDGAVGELRRIVQRLVERRDLLDMRIARASQRRERSAARIARLTRRETALENELRETRQTLRNVSSGRDNLGDRLAATLAELHQTRERYQTALSRRKASEAKAEELAAKLDRLRTQKTALDRKVAEVSQKFAAAKTERDELLAERKQLAERVRRLEQTLGHVTDADKTDLAERVGNLETELVDAEETAETYRKRNKRLQAEVAKLRNRLKDVRQAQSGLFNHYADQAKKTIAEIEKTVAMTGLDVDRLMAKARAARPARGGPFVPAKAIADDVAGPARQLDRRMQRLRMLQNVLGRLPLTPPLDSYWVSSNFGKRRDPYTDRWAMHEGVDLAGQPGRPVRAAAPGTVTSAGWKNGYGRMVVVEHGYGITTRYGHLKAVTVDEGDEIDHRAQVGKVGNTGRSTGPHVHYEVRVEGEPVDPMNFLKAGNHAFKK